MSKKVWSKLLNIVNRDYRIPQADGMARTCISFATIGIFLVIPLEFLFDLKATSISLLVVSLVPHLVLWLVSLLRSDLNLGSVQSFVIYFIIQLHFVVKQEYLYVLIYWVPFLPLQALITKGIKNSLIWLSLMVLTILVDGFYNFNLAIGDRSAEYVMAGLIFLICMYAAFFLMYNIIGKSYHRATLKSEQINLLNIELARVNAQLEDRVQSRTNDLAEKNKQLEKIAFMNSHIVRSSVTRILAAAEVIKIDRSRKDEMTTVIVESSEELDASIKELGHSIQPGGAQEKVRARERTTIVKLAEEAKEYSMTGY